MFWKRIEQLITKRRMIANERSAEGLLQIGRRETED